MVGIVAASSSAASSKLRPSNVGTGDDLPMDIYKISARLEQSNVVAWTTLDPKLNGTIDDAICMEVWKGVIICPCLLPICIPCMIDQKTSTEGIIYNTYWVLTNTDLKIIVKSYEGCYGRVGETIKSIPLDSITDCAITAPSPSCCGGVGSSVPTIYIDTPSSGTTEDGPKHEAVGYGLAGYDWFASEILFRRDLLKGHLYQPQQHGQLFPQYHQRLENLPQAEAMVDRGTNSCDESVESRLQLIGDLLMRGIITDAEYEMQRREIIGSI